MREEDGGGGKSCVEPEIKFEKGPTGRADTDLSFILCKSGKKKITSHEGKAFSTAIVHRIFGRLNKVSSASRLDHSSLAP